MTMGMNTQMGERNAVLAHAAGTASSTPLATGYHDTRGNFRCWQAVFALGDMAAETIDCRIVKATDSGGSNKEVLKAATQLAAHATNNDDKSIVISLDAEDVDEAKPFIAAEVLTGDTTGGPVGMVLLGGNPRHGPVTDFDAASVAEIVN